MLDWICQALDLPLLTEDRAGFVATNGSAKAALGDRTCPNLVTSIGHLLGDDADIAALADAAARARAGERVSVIGPDDQRVLFVPAAPGLASAMFAPAGLAETDAVRRRAEETDRSAAMSHELANALGAIAGWARLAQQGHRVDEAMRLIERSAQTAWASARQTLGEVSGQRGRTEAPRTDVSAFVDEIARLLTPKAMRSGVDVETRIVPGLCVAAERSQLWSVVWNLATNAVEAMDGGGRLDLLVQADRGAVVIRVEDSGPGMDATTRERIFDRYFTTKATGTGLGLGNVKRGVDALGGEIQVHSAPGKGTRFSVRLPAVESDREAPTRSGAKRSSGVYLTEPLDARILVVDDDAVLRDMVAAALELRGARVEMAANCEEAVARGGRFDLVLVDLLLGSERGDRVLATLRAQGLAGRALLMSGTELPAQLAEGGRPDAVLRKPFELDVLFEEVAGALTLDAESSATA